MDRSGLLVFTPRGRAYIVADAHATTTCTLVLATMFKRGESILNYRPVGPARVIGSNATARR